MADEVTLTVVEEGRLPPEALEPSRGKRVFVIFDEHTKTEALRGHVALALDVGDGETLLFEEPLPVQPDGDTYTVLTSMGKQTPDLHYTIDAEIEADDG